jgi:hypothetical protein
MSNWYYIKQTAASIQMNFVNFFFIRFIPVFPYRYQSSHLIHVAKNAIRFFMVS